MDFLVLNMDVKIRSWLYSSEYGNVTYFYNPGKLAIQQSLATLVLLVMENASGKSKGIQIAGKV
jgi:hypothetical protein